MTVNVTALDEPIKIAKNVLTQLQTLFIGITIPILLLTPIIIAKKIQKKDDDCTLNTKRQ